MSSYLCHPIVLTAFFFFSGACFAAEVNLYSARKEVLIKPLLDQFTAASGIQVNLLTGAADTLLKRLASEGRNTPADVLLTTDAARLHRAEQAGLLQPLSSPVLEAAVPAPYRSPAGLWFGLSLRHRVFVYAPRRVREEELGDYLELAARRWRGRLCVRSSTNVYNQSLVAALMVHHGAPRVEEWARGLVQNLSRPPVGGDRDQIRAVAAGQCDLAIVNNYYLAGMLDSSLEEERATAAAVRLFWPAQDAQGVHVNISGAGITRHAKHPAEARRLLEFLVSDAAQRWYATVNHEYPVRGDTLSGIHRSWGTFKADVQGLALLGGMNRQAILLMDRAGWK